MVHLIWVYFHVLSVHILILKEDTILIFIYVYKFKIQIHVYGMWLSYSSATDILWHIIVADGSTSVFRLS